MPETQKATPKDLVAGLGGFFFRSKDPEALASWYQQFFGINPVQSESLWIQKEGPTVFAPFKQDTGYFGEQSQMYMLNFRITDLDAFVELLKAAGVRIDENRQDEVYGKFAWVYDPEGTKIELWEPK